MKRTDLKFIGIDGWDRPVYQDPNGLLWKDTTLGSDTPSFASACNNEFEGEPDMPIEMTYPDFEYYGTPKPCYNTLIDELRRSFGVSIPHSRVKESIV